MTPAPTNPITVQSATPQPFGPEYAIPARPVASSPQVLAEGLEHDRHLDHLNQPLHQEDLGNGHTLIVWTTANDWRLQVYRTATGRDPGSIRVSRALPVTATRHQAIALGRALAAVELAPTGAGSTVRSGTARTTPPTPPPGWS